MAENGASEQIQPKNETTVKSQGWLQKNAGNIAKWIGNTVITAAGEFFTILGGVLTPFSVAAGLMTLNPLFLLGVAPSAIGAALEWGGARNAGPVEKTAFVATKLAMAGGGLALGPVAMGVSAASGLLAQRHRA